MEPNTVKSAERIRLVDVGAFEREQASVIGGSIVVGGAIALVGLSGTGRLMALAFLLTCAAVSAVLAVSTRRAMRRGAFDLILAEDSLTRPNWPSPIRTTDLLGADLSRRRRGGRVLVVRSARSPSGRQRTAALTLHIDRFDRPDALLAWLRRRVRITGLEPTDDALAKRP